MCTSYLLNIIYVTRYEKKIKNLKIIVTHQNNLNTVEPLSNEIDRSLKYIYLIWVFLKTKEIFSHLNTNMYSMKYMKIMK